jgi:virginiamycin A acetyltransferase
MAGVPAKRIRYRFEKNAIDRLLQLKWWDWTEEKIAKNTDFLMNDFPDPKFEQIHDK